MYVLNVKCEWCFKIKTCCDVNTVYITETGNELPQRSHVCPECLMYTWMDMEDEKELNAIETTQRPHLTRIK